MQLGPPLPARQENKKSSTRQIAITMKSCLFFFLEDRFSLNAGTLGRRYIQGTIVKCVRNGFETGGVRDIGITTSITGGRNVEQFAVIEMVGRENLAAQLFGRLDDSGSQAHLHVPFNVAVEQEDTGIVGLETQHGIRVCVYRHDVPHGRFGVVITSATRPGAGSATWAL